MNFCLNKNIIDNDTITFYLDQLNNNLCFYVLYTKNYFLGLCDGKIAIHRKGVSSSDPNLFKYIIVTKENLDAIKDIEGQLEEKINQITV